MLVLNFDLVGLGTRVDSIWSLLPFPNISRPSGNILSSLETFQSVGNLLGRLEAVWKLSRLSGKFPRCPKGFQVVCQPGGQFGNQCKLWHLVANFAKNGKWRHLVIFRADILTILNIQIKWFWVFGFILVGTFDILGSGQHSTHSRCALHRLRLPFICPLLLLLGQNENGFKVERFSLFDPFSLGPRRHTCPQNSFLQTNVKCEMKSVKFQDICRHISWGDRDSVLCPKKLPFEMWPLSRKITDSFRQNSANFHLGWVDPALWWLEH